MHFFALAGPDLLLGIDADPADRNIVGLLKHAPEVARSALTLRSIGQRISELIGGRPTHPVVSVAGGVAAPLSRERHETFRKLAAEGLSIGTQLVETARGALAAKHELMTSLPLETHYLGTVNDGRLDLYSGELRLCAPDGTSTRFAEDDWAAHLREETLPTSYGKYVSCLAGDGARVSFRVGPLARLNCADRIGTPLAQAELERFREVGGYPCHQTVMFHSARLVELLHAAEKLVEIANDPEILSDQVCAGPKQAPRNATAHVEAPRGVLIHDYSVDGEGIVTAANLIVATQQNLSSIDRTLGQSAERYLDRPDEELLNGIEFGIRCYDPCLSCATHRLGEMKLDVEIRQGGEVVRRVRRPS